MAAKMQLVPVLDLAVVANTLQLQQWVLVPVLDLAVIVAKLQQ